MVQLDTPLIHLIFRGPTTTLIVKMPPPAFALAPESFVDTYAGVSSPRARPEIALDEAQPAEFRRRPFGA